jgi:hypothetical protein
MTLPTQIAASDIALFQKAQVSMAQAQAKIELVSQHLAEVYKLSATDKVDMTTGVILRAEPEAPPA